MLPFGTYAFSPSLPPKARQRAPSWIRVAVDSESVQAYDRPESHYPATTKHLPRHSPVLFATRRGDAAPSDAHTGPVNISPGRFDNDSYRKAGGSTTVLS